MSPARMRALLARNPGFLKTFFDSIESRKMRGVLRAEERLASRWALKSAFAWMLFLEGFLLPCDAYRELRVYNRSGGEPGVQIRSKAFKELIGRCIGRTQVSLTHTRRWGMAFLSWESK